MENKISFKEFLKICTEFVDTNAANLDDFLELQKRLSVRAYLTMDEKAFCLTRVMLDSDRDIDIPSQFFVAAFEIAILFDVILAYTNVDYENIKIDEKTYENYDAIYMSGMADYILDYCQKDLDRVIRMADRSISYENLLNMIESLQNFDGDAVRGLTEEYKKFKEETDPQMIHDMATIMTYNDPAFGDMVDKINNESLEKAFSDEKIREAFRRGKEQ